MILSEDAEDFDPRFQVVGCLIESRGQILLLERAPGTLQTGTWGVPGGKVDDEEGRLAAVLREIREESGISLDPASISPLHTLHVRYAGYDFVYHAFRASLGRARPRVRLNPREHSAHVWLPAQEALRLRLIEDEDTSIRLAYGL